MELVEVLSFTIDEDVLCNLETIVEVAKNDMSMPTVKKLDNGKYNVNSFMYPRNLLDYLIIGFRLETVTFRMRIYSDKDDKKQFTVDSKYSIIRRVYLCGSVCVSLGGHTRETSIIPNFKTYLSIYIPFTFITEREYPDGVECLITYLGGKQLKKERGSFNSVVKDREFTYFNGHSDFVYCAIKLL